MATGRRCSKTGCARPATATLTYVYADSTAVLGPLASYAEPHCYDLCEVHSQRLTAPKGWEVLRLSPENQPPSPTEDDLLAIANAVREAGRAPLSSNGSSLQRELGRRGHLRAIPPQRDDSRS